MTVRGGSTAGRRAARPRVLLANELGAGLGHARRLGAIADALGERFECELALPNTAGGRKLVPGSNYRRSHWPQPELLTERRGAYVGSYGDILGLLGWDDPGCLRAQLSRAESSLDAAAPDFLIADFAPAAMLAAAGRIPVLWVGHSYTTPPLDAPRFAHFWSDDTLALNEDVLHASILGVQQARGAPYFSDLPAAFSHAEQIVCCSDELDIYAACRTEIPAGHIVRYDPAPAELRAARVVGYLPGNHIALGLLAEGLVALKRPVLLYVSNPPQWLEQRVAGSQVALATEPLVFPQELRSAAAVIHTGGSNLSEEALSLGIPQVVVSTHIEQHLVASMLARFGLVQHLQQGFQHTDLSNALAEALGETMQRRVREHSKTMKARYPSGALSRIVGAVERHLGSG